MRLVSLCISVCVLSICSSEFDRGSIHLSKFGARVVCIVDKNHDIYAYINCFMKKKKKKIPRNIIHDLFRDLTIRDSFARIRSNPELVHVLPSLDSCICASSEYRPCLIIVISHLSHTYIHTHASHALTVCPDASPCACARDLSLLESVFRNIASQCRLSYMRESYA